MDRFLIDYLQSGKSWILVGSGPSNEMGYPSWSKLATIAVNEANLGLTPSERKPLDAAIKANNFPEAFELTRTILGGPRLLHLLQDALKPSGTGEIYKALARWPAAVYLTTNYDDEIHRKLVDVNEAYLTYSNSEDYLGLLVPDITGVVVKLHGDLKSENGLILTSSQYNSILNSDGWKYWRTKMTSIFQMNRIVIVGHSLTDPNFRHVLKAAREGAAVNQPICWIAPDPTRDQIREYLEQYRIRVIPYDNRDGKHADLLRVIRDINAFVPARETIGIRDDIARVSRPPLGENAAAPGFFVFNKLAGQANYEEKRVEIVCSAIQAAVPELSSKKSFSLSEALHISGWPSDLDVSIEFQSELEQRLLDEKIFVSVNDAFCVAENAKDLIAENTMRFEHLRDRFKKSLELRIKRDFPTLTPDAEMIANDIENSLTGYFRAGGLSLASTLFSGAKSRDSGLVPTSIIGFITEASARYDSFLKRDAFTSASVNAFVQSTSAEREYLGRISQGFFAYHLLGVFGDVAIERQREAAETAWLVDSNAQIPALALAAPTNLVFVDCFSRLRNVGVRLFTTEKLFQEAYSHLWFAGNVVKEFGSSSADATAAATGQAPYAKANQFLEGFFRWQDAGNPHDWETYLYTIFGERNPSRQDVRKKLSEIGIDVIALDDWPGFEEANHGEIDGFVARIINIRDQKSWNISGGSETNNEDLFSSDPYKKALPEAEAFFIVKKERAGEYNIISDFGVKSPAWFVSNTSLLNVLDGPRNIITWQPEAFLRFASTLSNVTDEVASEKAFQTLLWACAQSGLTLLDEKTVLNVLGGKIDQAYLSLSEQRKLYSETIESKYGESPEAVVARLSPANRELGILQLNNEMIQTLERRLSQAEDAKEQSLEREAALRKQLLPLEKFRGQLEAKKAKRARNIRKNAAKKGKKKTKK